MEEGFPLRRERVEPGGDDPLHGVGERQLLRGAALEKHPDVFLGVERVAARSLEQRLLCLGRKDRGLEQGGHEPRGVLAREGRERDGVRVALAPAPARAEVVELGPGRAEDEDRKTRRPVDQLLHEVEDRGIAPVQVLEQEDERPLRGDPLQKALPQHPG